MMSAFGLKYWEMEAPKQLPTVLLTPLSERGLG
jgi:hypothetical protein